ncbi:MAG: hypothetical protein WCK29_04440 [archaeon]
MSKNFIITRVYWGGNWHFDSGSKNLEIEIFENKKKKGSFSRALRYSSDRIHSRDLETLAYNIVFNGGFSYEEGDRISTKGLPYSVKFEDMEASYKDNVKAYAASKVLKDAFKGFLEYESASKKDKYSNPLWYVPNVFDRTSFLVEP